MLKDMAKAREDPQVGSPSPSAARQPIWRVLAGVAVTIQVLLLMGFFFMGLGWSGLWWYLTLIQGAVGVVLASVSLVKKPVAAFLVPPISLCLMLLFVRLDGLVATRVCSTEVLSAANELGAIPGFTERPEFQPELGKGCAARFNSPRPRGEVIEWYRSAGIRNGWILATPQPVDHAVMHKGTLTLDVWANTRDDRGMYIMSVRRA